MEEMYSWITKDTVSLIDGMQYHPMSHAVELHKDIHMAHKTTTNSNSPFTPTHR